jgi:hypothetical protein
MMSVAPLALTLIGRYLARAKGAFSSKPGASPQGSDRITIQALKARLNTHGQYHPDRFRNESRFQRWRFALHERLGRCPRLIMSVAPLALRLFLQVNFWLPVPADASLPV